MYVWTLVISTYGTVRTRVLAKMYDVACSYDGIFELSGRAPDRPSVRVSERTRADSSGTQRPTPIGGASCSALTAEFASIGQAPQFGVLARIHRSCHPCCTPNGTPPINSCAGHSSWDAHQAHTAKELTCRWSAKEHHQTPCPCHCRRPHPANMSFVEGIVTGE